MEKYDKIHKKADKEICVMSYQDVVDLLNIADNDEVVDLILDTDAFNEQDDQFAIAHAMLSPEKINLLSINAAPFTTRKMTDPALGMEQSYEEILKVMNMVEPKAKIPVFKGSDRYLPNKNTPVDSPAAHNIVNTVKNAKKRVYILAIGCITNLASAILMCPEIVNKASVVWLGGHSYQFPDPREMNLNQDIPAAQVVFNSGIPLVQIPAGGVTDHLTTTIPELEHYLNGKNEIGTYLTKIVTAVKGGKYAASKVIWDIAGTAYFTVQNGMTRVIQHTPILTDEGYFVNNDRGAPMVYVKGIKRDPVFADVFSKISGTNKM